MGKFKKIKKGNSDAVYSKKSASKTAANPFADAKPATAKTLAKKLNPFEVHVNKEKFNILGRICKHDKGLPGVSRGKAIKKRKETLGLEYRDKNKTNKFQDRRIGKHLTDDQLTEEILNARFLADKVPHIKKNKNSKFNLNDDEVLTHRGQTLEEIEKFYDERSDDDTEDEDLNADFTETANFGGDEQLARDRKTAIEDMIVEQKKRKLEISKEKEEVHELTEKLDSNYKQLINIMGKFSKKELKTKTAPDDYDKIMREMIFEPRGAVSDKLLSEEELAKIEKERLEKLENERLRRMRPDDEVEEENVKIKHRSADDVDDGYYLIEDVQDDETLTYNFEGKTIIGGKSNSTNDIKDNLEDANDDENEVDDEVEDEENSDNNDEEEEEEEEKEKEDNGEEEEDEDNDEEDDDNSEEEDDDNMSDLKTSDEESASDNEDKTQTVLNKISTKIQSNGKKSADIIKNIVKPNVQQNDKLPFIIEMPATSEEFIELLKNHTPKDQSILIERLLKFNHPKLEGVDRENVVKLFAFILQYINELFCDATETDVRLSFRIFKELQKPLYDLLQLNPAKMSQMILNVIVEKQKKYRKKPKVYPGVDTLVFFMLISKLYSTSDFRHPIVTPCYIFMQNILTRAHVRSRQDIAMGLLIIICLLNYSQQSKRFLPAAFNFLQGIIYLGIPKREVETFKIEPAFITQGPFSKLLTISESVVDKITNEERIKCEDLVMTTISMDFKVRALNVTLKLIKDALTNVQDNIGSNYLATPFIPLIKRLTIDLYPPFVHKNYEAALTKLKETESKGLKQIVPSAKKPKALRLLEPRFEAVYDDKRRPKLSEEKERQAKLLHKVKREMKGAIREIRRDTEFLQNMRIQQQIQSDMERKEKVKRIYQEASIQQGELNKMARDKKKMKF